jgi:hypothetical protein
MNSCNHMYLVYMKRYYLDNDVIIIKQMTALEMINGVSNSIKCLCFIMVSEL